MEKKIFYFRERDNVCSIPLDVYRRFRARIFCLDSMFPLHVHRPEYFHAFTWATITFVHVTCRRYNNKVDNITRLTCLEFDRSDSLRFVLFSLHNSPLASPLSSIIRLPKDTLREYTAANKYAETVTLFHAFHVLFSVILNSLRGTKYCANKWT